MDKFELTGEQIDFFRKNKVCHKGEKSFIYEIGENEFLKDLSCSSLSDEILYRKKLKVEMSPKFIELKNKVSLPRRMAFYNGKFFGYSFSNVIEEDFEDYLFENMDDLDFDIIVELILNLENVIKIANRHKIVLPDIANPKNIKYDIDTGDTILIDYDGFQIGQIPTNTLSKLVSGYKCNNKSLVFTDKYYDKNTELFTNELDKFSTFALFMHASCDCVIGDLEKDKLVLKEFSKSFGFNNTSIEDVLYSVFDTNKSNEFFGESLLEFSNEYKISPIKVKDKFGYHGTFVKKSNY